MLKILAFLTRREDIETQALLECYGNHHVPLIRRLAPAPIVCKAQLPCAGDELIMQEDDTIDLDVVTELVFPDRLRISPGAPPSERARPPSRSPLTS